MVDELAERLAIPKWQLSSVGALELTILDYKVFWVCPQRRRERVCGCRDRNGWSAPGVRSAWKGSGLCTQQRGRKPVETSRGGSAGVDLASADEQDARRMIPTRVLEPEVTDIDLTAADQDTIDRGAANSSLNISMRRRPAVALLVLVLAALGCDSKPDVPSKGPPPLPPQPPTATSGAASVVGAGSAAPAASIALPAPGDASAAGTWEGSYDARKGAVVLPDRVKDKTRTSDDGKLMVGAGKVELTVTAAGDVRGKATGALGEAHLTGKLVDEGGGFLRASWYPDDATTPNAMTGVLYGPVKDGVISAMIRVAGPDAVLVRESKIELKKR